MNITIFPNLFSPVLLNLMKIISIFKKTYWKQKNYSFRVVAFYHSKSTFWYTLSLHWL